MPVTGWRHERRSAGRQDEEGRLKGELTMGGKTGRAAKAGAQDWWGVKLLERAVFGLNRGGIPESGTF
jgi:hypothetical protein